MLGSSSSSSYQSAPPHKLIIWDIDDTVLALLLGELKNYSLLVPILMYISHSPSLMSAICTNRRTRDEKPIDDDLSLSELLKLLETFGILFHPSLIVTLGDVKEGLELLQQEYGEHAKRQSELGLISEPPLNILGKNFQVNRLHNAANTLFQTILSTQSIYLIDDNSRIIDDSIKAQYQGICATDPSDLIVAASNVDYLHALANAINISEYLNSLMTHPEHHQEDPSLRKIAAILYGLNTGHLSLSITPDFLAILFQADEIGPAIISVIDNFKLYCETHTSGMIKNQIYAASVSEKTKQRQLDFLSAEGPYPLRDSIIDNLNILSLWLQPFTKIPRTSSAPSAWIPSSIIRSNSTSRLLRTDHRRPRSTALLSEDERSLTESFSAITVIEQIPPQPSITWAYSNIVSPPILPLSSFPFDNADKSKNPDLNTETEPKKSPRYEQ